MGDLAQHRGSYDVAIERFSRACALCESHAESLGMGYYLVRSQLGLAKAFHALRMRQEERAALAAASDLLAERRGYSFDFIWEGGDAQAYFDPASYHAAVGNDREALLALGKAATCGWRDLPTLKSSDFARLREAQGLMRLSRVQGSTPPCPSPSCSR
jgi:hypothetical protein